MLDPTETLRSLPELNHLYKSMEKRKAEFLTYLERLTDAERRRCPTVADWSPLQVMEHVVVVEEWMAAPYEALSHANSKVLIKGRLFITLGGGLMRSGFRMPTVPQAEPQTDLDFTTIKQRWEIARILLSRKLATVTQETQPVPIALHPIAGPLNAKQVLELLDVHLAYHWRHRPHVK